MSTLKVNESIEGTFTSRTSGERLNTTTGETDELVRLHFTREDGTKFLTFEDAGLRNAMANADVKPGDYIKIVKLDQVDIGNGRRSNNYDIFMSASN